MKLIVRILQRLNLLQHLNFRLTINNGSGRVIVPVKGKTGVSLLWNKERWMFDLVRRLRRLTSTESAFIDVGVNLGQTLIEVKSVDSNLPYYGFEPNPNCVSYVNELIEINQYQRVVIVPAGIGNTTGVSMLQMTSDDLTDSSASAIAGFRNNIARTMVIAMLDEKNLNNVLPEEVGIIKIDVEGGELEVILGLTESIRKFRPYIICEVLPAYNRENTFRVGRQQRLEQVLSSLQYKIFHVMLDGTLIPLHEIGINADFKNCNYLFVPGEKVEETVKAFD